MAATLLNATEYQLTSDHNITSNVTSPNASYSLTPSDAPDLYHFYFLLNGIVGCILCLIGLLGNVTSILVLTMMFHRSRTSTNIFLLTMAVSDFAVLTIYLTYDVACIAVPSRPMIALSDTVGYEGTFTYFVFFTWYFPANIFMTLSNWCIVSVMTFRFVAVYFPLRAQLWCSVFRAKVVIVVISLCSVALICPEFFTVRIVSDRRHRFQFKDTELFTDRQFNAIYYGFVEALNSIIPFIICTLLTILLTKTLRSKDDQLTAQNAQQHSSQRRRALEQRRISTMLLGITLWFMFCTLPSFVCRIAKYFITPSASSKTSWIMFRGISDVFLVLNHTTNFVLYAATNRSYRMHLIDLALCRDRRALDREASVANSLRIHNDRRATTLSSCHYSSIKNSSP